MSDSTGFGRFVPGFEFLQNLAGQAASGVAQGISQNMPQLPNLSHWIAPTFNVEELQKRIEELKAVHYWLDQNSKALGATIQALEVQKMTLSTLEHMNFSLGDVANAFKLKAADSMVTSVAEKAKPPAKQYSFKLEDLQVPDMGSTAEDEPEDGPEEDLAPEPVPVRPRARKAPSKPRKSSRQAAAAVSPNFADPMQWWGGLTQQFQSIAANAFKDAAKNATLDGTREMASSMTGKAVKTATDMAGKMAGSMMETAGTMAGVGKAAMAAATKAPAKSAAGRASGSAKAPAAVKKTSSPSSRRPAATKKAAPRKSTGTRGRR